MLFRSLAPSSFPSAGWEDGFPSSPWGLPHPPAEPGPRGLAPSSGPLLARPFPVELARCSLGLDRYCPCSFEFPPFGGPLPDRSFRSSFEVRPDRELVWAFPPFEVPTSRRSSVQNQLRTSKTAPRSGLSVRPPGFPGVAAALCNPRANLPERMNLCFIEDGRERHFPLVLAGSPLLRIR